MHAPENPPSQANMRRRLSLISLLLLPLALPAGAYELLQKTAERRLENHGLLALSNRAESEIPWRPRTGSWWLDHAEHELREAGRFYALLGHRVGMPRR